MDSPPKLTGETLVVHHIPLVHCQVPDRPCCSSSGTRTNPFCQADLAVARSNSQLERDLLQVDSLVYSNCLQQLVPDAGLAPSSAESPEEPGGRLPGDPALPPVTHRRRQNPFLLHERRKEALELYEESPLEEKAFHLHGRNKEGAFHLHEMALPPFRLHDGGAHPVVVVKPWSAAGRLDVAEGQEDKRAGDPLASESMELDEYSCPPGDPAGAFSFDQEWADDADDELVAHQELAGGSRTCSCSSSEFRRCRCSSLSSQSEPLDQPMGDAASDSSCNSSDGVLVNFSALYHKMNGHGHGHPNLNSGHLSCGSSSGSHSEEAAAAATGAFYLDLHSSPSPGDPKTSGQSQDPEGSGKACRCRRRHPSSPVLDANCNSYPSLCEPCASEGSELTACFQSQARLVVATQNYYKLVTCDLSSQSSPSPAGSSITSCSEEPPKGSPVQPTEYYLFHQPGPPSQEESDDTGGGGGSRAAESQGEAEKAAAIEGQVYVNVSPPAALSGGRQRSRSYDRHLDRSPTGRLGSLERLLSCPVKLGESPGAAAAAAAPQSSPGGGGGAKRRVTSFAELAKGRKRNGSSPALRASGGSSLEFSPSPPEGQKEGRDASRHDWAAARHCHSLPPMPSAPWKDPAPKEALLPHGPLDSPEQPLFSMPPEPGAGGGSHPAQRDVRARADGGAADGKVVRYRKDQRPTTLPIQPFVFQHHFPSRAAKARPRPGHLAAAAAAAAASLSQLYGRAAAARPPAASQADQPPPPITAGGLGQGRARSADGAAALGDGGGAPRPVPETTRPSPLGSYSPVRSSSSRGPFFQRPEPSSSSSPSSSSGSPTPESHPPRSRSCPASASLLLPATGISPAATGAATRRDPPRKAQPEGPPPPSAKPAPPEPRVQEDPPPACPCALGAPEPPQWKEAVGVGAPSSVLPRPLNANHLSPQALKWREYRRRNPLGSLDRVSQQLMGSLDGKPMEGQLPWRNPVFEFPGALTVGRASCRLNGHLVRPPPLNCSDFFPDYFSLAEKPPAEFCLSPDGNTESVSIDLVQKKGLVKAINMAVDLIVAHFGTSRDPGVKAKLGNSSVSPNIGHLVLKYLCPALRDLLGDGLRAYVLDVIIGQRRNTPWSVVEASTQLGPSTKVVHGLYSKVSQCPELTSHAMRFNAFVFGLLNIRSLEFWFNHLYHHEDIIQVHYLPVGFLSLAQGACQGLFEEVLLLLQPLSLLPFSLDLLFEHRLLQKGKEQQQQKELLRGKQDLALSAHSTLQLMRTQGSGPGGVAPGRDPRGHPAEGTALSGAGEGEGGRVKGVGAPSEGPERRAEEGGSDARPKAPPAEGSSEAPRDKQASWWYQLMRSSQVYIEGSAEGSRLGCYEQRKKAGAAPRQGEPRKGPPPREGVVEGAEACPITEGPLKGQPPRETEGPVGEPLPGKEKAKEKGPPFWMGSPPDSVLAELKRAAEESGSAPKPAGSPEESRPSALEGSLPKWGHLFGSRKAPKEPKQPNRLPSGWLSLDRSIFQLMAQTVGASVWREAASEGKRMVPDRAPVRPKPQPRKQPLMPAERSAALEASCEVKALCHHLATEAGQLSFRKGDVLRVLSKVDADWLRCGRGAESGRVPIMYVTHREDEDY